VSTTVRLVKLPFEVADQTLDLAGKTLDVAGKTLDVAGKGVSLVKQSGGLALERAEPVRSGARLLEVSDQLGPE
jgi:hypothetical protein